MEYIALNNSFDSDRNPSFCERGRVYDFVYSPGKHFKQVGKPAVAIVVEKKVVEPVKDEKEALIEQAKSLGLEVNGRHSVATIAKMIGEALAEKAENVNE